MKSTLPFTATLLAALTVGPAASGLLSLQGAGNRASEQSRIAVTAYGDFSIVPPNLGPYLNVGTDGDLYVHDMPLVGRFQLSGTGVSIEAKFNISFSGELDVTGTGAAWFPITLTTTIDGVKTIIFEGRGNADEVNLVASGKVSLSGRGPYTGSTLELSFEEIGPGDSNTFNFRGHLLPAPRP